MTAVPTAILRRTPLFEQHKAAGAKIVPFAGWEMPVQYEGIRQEHVAVRTDAGVFDVSHMGEIETTGPGARDLLQHLLSNDIDKLSTGGAQYSVLCQEDGGVIDDLFTYKLDDNRYLTVTNASNHPTDFAWFCEHAGGFDVEVTDRANHYGMLAVQGPNARAKVAALAQSELPARFQTKKMRIAGVDLLACGTGYTGEDGLELLPDAEDSAQLWRQLLEAGIKPVGLGARDTLRLEVCYHLYGNDLSRARTPIEGGLHWACALETGFVGCERVRQVLEQGPAEMLVALKVVGQGIPRQGNPVLFAGAQVGEVTSGTMSPSLELGIGMAYVSPQAAAVGTRVQIDVRGKLRDAEVVAKPIYKKTA